MKESMSKEKKEIIRYTALNLGSDWRVVEHISEDEEYRLPIVQCGDEIVTYVTGGFHEWEPKRDGVALGIRLELISAALQEYRRFPAIIASTVFYIANHWIYCCPGAVIPDVVPLYYPELTTKHIYLTSAEFWGDAFKSRRRFGGLEILWLWAVPITDNEYKLLRKVGEDLFESHLERSEIRYFDLDRPCSAGSYVGLVEE